MTVKAIQEINFSEMLYRGYWVKRNALTGLMWIEKDGQLIHRVPECLRAVARICEVVNRRGQRLIVAVMRHPRG